MTKFCFKCKKEFGKYTLQKYPPKNLEFEGKTIPQMAIEKGYLSEEEIKKILDPAKMTEPNAGNSEQ